jgi:hypothetical protein
MMSGLVATLALGFVSGSSADGNGTTEMRLAYHRLIVGTWEMQAASGLVQVWTFRRNGEGKVITTLPDGITGSSSFKYRINARRSELNIDIDIDGGASIQIIQLDRRVLVWESDLMPTREKLRRR